MRITYDYSISVPNLVKIPDDGTFDFSGYDVQPDKPRVCDLNHNESTTMRSGTYVTPNTLAAIVDLNNRWLKVPGANKLCLNDGSLKNGGFFDEGLTDRAQKCHGSHRLGIDVDVTVNANACTENLLDVISYNGETMQKIKVLTILAQNHKAYVPITSPYHFRFSR